MLTFLLPEVSLSRVSMPPLKETGERVPSTDSSLISLKGLAGTVELEWRGGDWDTGLVTVSTVSESLLPGGEEEAWREDCLFILDSRSKLLLVTFVSPETLALPLATSKK